MKRVGLWMVGIGLSLCAGLLAVGPGYADKGDSPKCTLDTLKGRYLFGGIATLFPPASTGPVLLSVAGYHVFNGDGTGIDLLSAAINGQSIENQLSNPNRSQYDITYTVNADCSGTYTVTSDGITFALYIAPDGGEVMVLGTTPGFVLVQGPSKRVSGK